MLWTKYRRNWETFPSKVWKYLAITLLGTNISQGFSAWWYHLLETFTSFLNISGCQIDRVMAEDPHFGKCWNPRRLGLDDFFLLWCVFCFCSEKKCFFGPWNNHLCRNTIRFSFEAHENTVSHIKFQVFIGETRALPRCLFHCLFVSSRMPWFVQRLYRWRSGTKVRKYLSAGKCMASFD